MIKEEDIQGRGRQGAPRLDKASLNKKEKRRKSQIKEMKLVCI